MSGQDDLPSIDEFGERLKKARPGSISEQLAKHDAESQGTALGRGMRLASELLAALLVAGALGLFADRFLGTAPWFLLVGIFLGFTAGMMNVTRAMKEMNGSLEQADKDE